MPDTLTAQTSRQYLKVLRAANSLYLRSGRHTLRGLTLYDQESGHIQRAQAWAAENAPTDRDAAWLCSSFPELGAALLPLRLTPAERLTWLHPALSAARRLGDRYGETWHLGQLGLAHTAAGDVARAARCHRQALAIARGLGNPRAEAHQLAHLAAALAALGHPHRAIRHLERSLALMHELDDLRGLGTVLAHLAVAYLETGDPHRSIRYAEAALQVAQEVGTPDEEAERLRTLGQGRAGAGDTRLAVTSYRQALHLARALAHRAAEAQILADLGQLLAAIGCPRAALLHLHPAAQLAHLAGDRRTLAASLEHLSATYRDLGDFPRAHQSLLHAIDTYHTLADPRAAQLRPYLAYLQPKTTGPRLARTWQFTDSPRLLGEGQD